MCWFADWVREITLNDFGSVLVEMYHFGSVTPYSTKHVVS